MPIKRDWESYTRQLSEAPKAHEEQCSVESSSQKQQVSEYRTAGESPAQEPVPLLQMHAEF